MSTQVAQTPYPVTMECVNANVIQEQDWEGKLRNRLVLHTKSNAWSQEIYIDVNNFNSPG